jgi:adenosine deaminase
MTLTRAHLLIALLPAFAAAADAVNPVVVPIDARFAQLRNDPPSLYAFLLRMPKGGDLHNHVSGAVYAESYLRVAAVDGLCANLKTGSLVAPDSGGGCGDNVPAARADSDNGMRNALIDSLSMRNFVPGRESAHDHFFAAFGKFGPWKEEHHGEFLAEVTGRAADQNESYLELMAMNCRAASALGDKVGLDADFDRTRDRLAESGLDTVVQQMRARIAGIESGRRTALNCDAHPESPACRVVVRYVLEVLRESPKQQIFAQVMAGFRLASIEPMVVGVNFVQPEDGVISMRDYSLQMRIVGYARKQFPKVHVSLHAGELAPGLVPPDGLRFHVREAVDVAGAERIGHGVDILYETDSRALLDRMRQRHILVEINLTSNDQILGIRGSGHPLPAYRRAGVPVSLSTDDEGVARSHLTSEFLRAVLDYKLSYADVKEMARNSLRYAFADEVAKAQLQKDLEARLRAFESSVR